MPASVLDPIGLRPPRDGDGDGRVRDGTPGEAAAPRPPAGDGTRDFGDAAAIRAAIHADVLAAARALRPLQNARHSLTLDAAHYDGPEDRTLAEQKAALLEGRTLARRLVGTWTLRDNATGEAVARRTMTVAQVPYFSPRGTFIKGGNEYSIAHQLRLRPGVYARRKANGELEAHVNVLPGQGASHRIFMEPETGRFRLGMGQAKMPLLPLLRAMGAADARLRAAWGADLAHANMLHDDPSAVDKLHARLVRGEAAADPAGRLAAVKAAFEAMPLDPEVTRRTLGAPHDRVTLDALLDATRKLIAINRGEADVDDRDDLAFMTLHGPEDLLAERTGRDRLALGKHFWKASRRGDLDAMPAGLFTRGIEAALTSSGLAQAPESINPLQIYEQQGRVSRMGQGGIPSLQSVPDESRTVQPSHFGFVDPLLTPESLRAGVDSRVATLARKGPGGRIVSDAFRDPGTGRPLRLSPAEAAARTIAFPGELASGRPEVEAMKGGRVVTVPRHAVDAELGHMQHAYSPITNLVPMFSAVKPQRASMAARMLTQALPLVDPEAPHVRAGVPGKPGSFEHELGAQLGAVRSEHAGVVAGVEPGRIRIRGDDGRIVDHPIYNNFPFNRKTAIHQTPLVRPGQRVAPGALLARSNYTDTHGVSALGKNARVAYIPLEGHNFEDAVAVSESFAQRMTSDHLYQHTLDFDPAIKAGRDAHASIFPGAHDRAALAKFDDDGAIKVGTEVHQGDPLVLAARERERSHASLHRGHGPSFVDASVTWEHHSPGVVTDVARTAKGILVAVKTKAALEVGDKLSGRHGDKGVVGKIVADHDMPHDEHGVPFEVAMNPLGTISRTNPAQHVEGALGKIAARTGVPYVVHDFDKARIPDLTAFAEAELAKHGFRSDSTERVYDPAKHRWIVDPFTGGDPQTANRFVMKLHHTSASKAQGRGTAAYTSEGTPAKGGPEGSKRLSLMDINALLSHGATAVVRDAGVVRGQAQPEYWAALMAGHTPPEPKVPHVYEKFVHQLRAAGIDPVRKGSTIRLMALARGDVAALAGGRDLENAETVAWDAGLKPVKGGLFDPALTGGHHGERWASIRLHEPFPSPVMEEPIRHILGLTGKGFRAVLEGKADLGGRTGPGAVAAALAVVDVPREIARARGDVAGGRKGARDAAVRRLGYLKAAARLGLHPGDWAWDRVPVLPPKFRPVSLMKGSRLPMVADPNLLYRELFEANANLAAMAGRVDDVAAERAAVYDAMKGVVGLGDPVQPKNRERQVRGILRHVFGHSPKTGVVQRKLLGATTDLVGRAVITPDPALDIDEVGVPESKAWEIYRPFVMRHLRRRGMPAVQALRESEARTPLARQALHAAMAERPVIVTRAPVLHRYGNMGFHPVVVTGETVRMNPFVTKGYNADFDGDAVTYHVPASDDAVKDVIDKMLPSRNLFSVSSFTAHQLPSQEFLAGLYTASAARHEAKRPVVFARRSDALKAYRRGELSVADPVSIVDPES